MCVEVTVQGIRLYAHIECVLYIHCVEVTVQGIRLFEHRP
jgi:hypothetical protein